MINRISDKTSTPKPKNSLAEEPREFLHDAKTRFAPADNLYDAIRSDVARLGDFEFVPLARQYTSDPPFFNDPDFYDQE
jgi:hypothetical protein